MLDAESMPSKSTLGHIIPLQFCEMYHPFLAVSFEVIYRSILLVARSEEDVKADGGNEKDEEE